ncbi:MAG TPA: CDP-glucose 4,6-dehydratase [Pseudolabrys sp.]|nr:CDP-glucose 4,6-dehydratase [Pseudolabrys sp.]
MEAVVTADFWRGRRVLITGHTGFKGAWLSFWLREQGAEVFGYSLDPPTEPSLFRVAGIGELVARDIRADIRNSSALKQTLVEARPEVVFHLAAQSIVRLSYSIPLETFDVNILGTAHVLGAVLQTASVRAAVIVTSDKCYENVGDARSYRETDPMGGNDPYSASKGCAELIVASFRASAAALGPPASNIVIASVRSGNVVGGGDWSPDRLVPDCIRAFVSRSPVRLRNPGAVRPWLHVLEPLAGYIDVAERLLGANSARYATAFNFGPAAGNDANVLLVAQTVAGLWGEGARVEVVGSANLPEAATLRLDSTKAMQMLGWKPRWNLTETLERAVEWYKSWQQGRDLRQLMSRQLGDFAAKAAT